MLYEIWKYVSKKSINVKLIICPFSLQEFFSHLNFFIFSYKDGFRTEFYSGGQIPQVSLQYQQGLAGNLSSKRFIDQNHILDTTIKEILSGRYDAI